MLTGGAFRDYTFESFAGAVAYQQDGVTLDVRLQQSPTQWLTAAGTAPMTLFRPNPEGVTGHREPSAGDTVDIAVTSSQIDLGVVQSDESSRINGYIEKPTYDYCVSMGIYVFEPRVISYIPRGEYLDFPDLVKKMIASGEKVVGYQFDGYWQDLGRPDDYEIAAQDFEKLRAKFLPQEQLT